MGTWKPNSFEFEEINSFEFEEIERLSRKQISVNSFNAKNKFKESNSLQRWKKMTKRLRNKRLLMFKNLVQQIFWVLAMALDSKRQTPFSHPIEKRPRCFDTGKTNNYCGGSMRRNQHNAKLSKTSRNSWSSFGKLNSIIILVGTTVSGLNRHLGQ